MNDNEKPVQKAMRIFEALSGVDEELLVECNKDDVKSDKVIPFWKYGKAIAACFCLVVAGALVWNASETGGFRSTKSSDSAAALEAEQAADSYDMADTTENVQMDAGNGTNGVYGNDSNVTEGIVQKESVLEEEKESEDAGQIEDAKSEILEQGCSTPLPPDDREKISELAAKKLDVYGAFVPDELPNGYVYESGSKLKNSVTDEESGISLCWTKGMDSISWTVKQMDAKDVVWDDSVFKAEDLSLELVESRMKVVQDAGDTDTPRGNFSVFYEEGILIEFRGDGTAEEIWNLFTSLQR